MENEELTPFQDVIQYQDDFIWVKPICDMLNIDYKYQVEVIRNDPILSNMVEKKSSKELFGDKRSRILLPKKGFLRWIQLINPNIADEAVRENLLKFQTVVFDLLFGSLEAEQEARQKYRELANLRKQYNQTGNRIKSLERQLDKYLMYKFQYQLEFQNED